MKKFSRLWRSIRVRLRPSDVGSHLRTLVSTLLAAAALECVAAGPYSQPLSNAKEIRAAKSTIDDIDIRHLRLADYPLLAKFTRVKRVWLWSPEGTSATDAKLNVLAQLNFTNLTYMN